MAFDLFGSSRKYVLVLVVVSGWLTALACGGDDSDDAPWGSGGTMDSSGGNDLGGATTGGDSFGTGGVQNTGGSSTGGELAGGVSSGGLGIGGQATGGASSGGLSTGGMTTGGLGTGGLATGGVPTGGMATGGFGTGGFGTGGLATGGVATGGAPTGGMVTGGVSTGGMVTGGIGTGGAATGGVGTGGMATGGTSTGGTGTGGTGGGEPCVPYHLPGSQCSSCHGAACTCETQYTTCMMGVCASPDTPIATPTGERPIASLSVGDIVFSVDRGEVVAVPLRKVSRARARLGHQVVRVVLATGSVLEVSGPHPTADGRTFGELRAGGQLGGVEMVDVEMVPYRHAFTYDILPASDSGTYFAGGALIGSTIAEASAAAIWEWVAAMTSGAATPDFARVEGGPHRKQGPPGADLSERSRPRK
ncbi:MAG: hypothetical protein JW751_04295 [Polyangiaceae bacterium]|nr:hypothetical protein [Polyangiaceae bacterium]